MPISPENVELSNKILAGISKAFKKLYEQKAANNQTVVISVNGIPTHVPAKELLEQQKQS